MKVLDSDHVLVFACALAPPGVDLAATRPTVAMSAFSGERACAIASAHQVRTQLASHANAFGIDLDRSARLANELAAAVRTQAGHAMLGAGALRRILDKLRAEGIMAVPFKGPAFATFLGDGPGSREIADLDVLIAGEDLLRAVRALAPLGLSPDLPSCVADSPWLVKVTPELPLSEPGGSLLIELHWRLAPAWFPSPCLAEDVFARASERDFFGCRAWWPAAEELLLIHVADGMKSCGCGIRWIADFVRILRHQSNVDWHHVRNVSARRGGLNIVRVALAVAESICDNIAHRLGIPELALDLPLQAKALAREAMRSARLVSAVNAICSRVQADAWPSSALEHFKWALQVADRPGRVALEVARYLAGPTVTDLADPGAEGESDFSLRLRALCRRLRLR
jgi:hypothetical protein